MAVEACFDHMIEMKFPVTETDEPGRELQTYATRLGPDGMELDGRHVPPKRYTWLSFEIPGADHPVKALAEVVGVLAVDGANRVLVRFKHLFPRDRQALVGFVSARAAA